MNIVLIGKRKFERCWSVSSQTPQGLVLDASLKHYIRIAPEAWDVPTLRAGSGWTASGRILMFVFNNFPESLNLTFSIGPGPQHILTGLLALVSAKHPPFESSKKSGKLWYQIYEQPFLQKASYEGSDDEVTQEITKRWERFVQSDLPKIEEAIRAEAWIWEQSA